MAGAARVPNWVTDGDDVGFLDLPGVAAHLVVREVERTLTALAPGAVLCVYTDDEGAVAALTRPAGVGGRAVSAVIAHDDGGWSLVIGLDDRASNLDS